MGIGPNPHPQSPIPNPQYKWINKSEKNEINNPLAKEESSSKINKEEEEDEEDENNEEENNNVRNLINIKPKEDNNTINISIQTTAEGDDEFFSKLIFNKYKLVQKLGEGSFGKVFKFTYNSKFYAVKFEIEKKDKIYSKIKQLLWLI